MLLKKKKTWLRILKAWCLNDTKLSHSLKHIYIICNWKIATGSTAQSIYLQRHTGNMILNGKESGQCWDIFIFRNLWVRINSLQANMTTGEALNHFNFFLLWKKDLRGETGIDKFIKTNNKCSVVSFNLKNQTSTWFIRPQNFSTTKADYDILEPGVGS